MAVYACCTGGIVRDLIAVDPDGPSLAERYHPDVVALLVPVPDGADVAVGWSWDGGQFSPPAAAGPPTAAQMRATRARLLSGSDWTQLADAPLASELRAAWAVYRQALRDVPQQVGFPADVTWPAAPG